MKNLVIEYHYSDADLGAYDTKSLTPVERDAIDILWAGFDASARRAPDHIIIRRRDNEKG